MNCSNCGKANELGSRYCIECGHLLVLPVPENENQPVRQPDSTGGYVSYQSPQNASARPSPLEALNIWGPFAGFGKRETHKGWLMDGQGSQLEVLVQKIESKFDERQIPDAYLNKEVLVAKGVLVETRPYYILQRQLVSVALHIAQYGKDLFVSLASYMKPPISTFRVGVAVLMVLYGLYFVFVFPYQINLAMRGIAGSLFSGSSGLSEALFFLLCFSAPIGFLNIFMLLILFLYSVYKWVQEKDFLAVLRVPPNEFNWDDLMALEKAVEQTVRQSLDEIGLNSDDMLPTSMGETRRLT